MKKGFTLIELAVAVGLLVVVLMIASTIFRVSIDSQRIAMANTEIMQKLRAITDQLNADFEGLRKDGEIFVTWVAQEAGVNDAADPDGYVRMDRIMFFTEGDFQSYGYGGGPLVRGNFARVCYLLARDENNDKPGVQVRNVRRLARTQHIMASDAGLDDLPSLVGLNSTKPVDAWGAAGQEWFTWNNEKEYDKISLNAWKMIDPAVKMGMLSVITDITAGGSAVTDMVKGAKIDTANMHRIHMLLAEGVGEFKIQGWNDLEQRWVPEVNPDGDAGNDLTDSDFFLAGGQPDCRRNRSQIRGA